MRLPRTLFRYLARETIQYGVLAFLSLAVVLVSQNLLRRLDDLLIVGFTRQDFLTVLGCLVPMLTAYAVPIAFLVGSILAVRRLCGDGEILAMRSCGVGLRAIVAPTLALAALVSALTAYLLISVEHDSRRELLTLFKTVAARGGMFEPGKFANLNFGVLFVESRDRDDTLRGIAISDASNPRRPYQIFAETGRFHFEEEANAIQLNLYNGELHLEPTAETPNRYQRIRFDEFAYLVDVTVHLRGVRSAVRPKQMNSSELREVLVRAERGDPLIDLDERNPTEYELEIHRRYAMPMAPIIFGLLAVPLGLTEPRRGSGFGLVLCLLLVFGYYASISTTQFLARGGLLTPLLAFWIPNTAFIAGGFWLLSRASKRMVS